MRDRIKRVFSLINDDVDTILLRNTGFRNPSFLYLTGLTNGVFEGATAVVSRDGGVDVFISALDQGEDTSNIRFHMVTKKRDFVDTLSRLIPPGSKIGVDGRYLTYQDYKSIKRILPNRGLRDVRERILLARLIKDKREVENIEEACKIASRVAEEIPGMLRDGVMEKEVADEIVYRMKKHGADGEAFETIVAFGENSAIPHHTHSERKLKRGDIVLVDFGATVDGYISDISRSFIYGKPSDKQRRMYEVVLNAQQQGIDSIKKGVTFDYIHSLVYRYINETEFKGRFIHSTGHTIGLEVHDGFTITQGCKKRFLIGMTFTVEPGIYLPDVGGIRIEDDLLMGEGGVRVLTTASKDFEV
ncbi:MAG: aminopeptidase P family protein [Thermoplasmata archaeon]|nr:aminopeptidase P family protein [Thermoplasmata archaeon]